MMLYARYRFSFVFSPAVVYMNAADVKVRYGDNELSNSSFVPPTNLKSFKKFYHLLVQNSMNID